MLQQNPLLYETKLYELIVMLPKEFRNNTHNQPFHPIKTLPSEFQYYYFSDSHLSEDLLGNMTSSLSSNADESPHANAVFQTSIKPTASQSLLFLYVLFN